MKIMKQLSKITLGAACFGAFIGCEGEKPAKSTNGDLVPNVAVPTEKPKQKTVKKEGNLFVSESGLKYEELKEGTGEAAKLGDSVLVHYTGWLKDGKKFESSLDRGKPSPFILEQHKVIDGWVEGIQGMKVGGKRKLIIPPDLAYGKTGTRDGVIPPNAELTFEIELLNID